MSRQESQWDRDETGNDQNRSNCRADTNDLVTVRVVQAESLKQTPQTVVQVQPDDNHGDDVKLRNVPVVGTEGGRKVAVNFALFEFSQWQDADGEVQQVKHDKERDQTTGEHHVQRGG